MTKAKGTGVPVTRDKNGRFTKGQTGNPLGRNGHLPTELIAYGREAPNRLKEISQNPDCPVKIKVDIEKWFAEMTLGKPKQQLDVDANVENTGVTTVVFEGDLDDWSE